MGKQKKEALFEYHLNISSLNAIQFEILSLRDLGISHKEDLAKPHIHSFYQIIWFKSGHGKHYIDFNEYQVSENTIFFIAKNQVHAFDRWAEYEGLVINFSEDFLVQGKNEVDVVLKCSMFNYAYQTPSCCVGSGNEYKLDEYIVQMQTELKEYNKYGQIELLRSYLKSFLIQIQRQKNELGEFNSCPSPVVGEEKRNHFTRFVGLVEQYYSQGYPVSVYAEMLCVSLRTLSNLTLQLVRKRPSQMLHERVVLEAKRLLLYSDLNVNEIANRIGFEDPSYFSKYFKKYTNQSPLSFRKSLQ